ncbi:MAG: DUF2958 domain-containing protein [Phycisphaerae bacterium]|nr:DUF2958 domain-containing protein [Phycisphaerae bacterium]
MELITARDKLPTLYGQENVADPIVHARLFDPCGSFTWFVLEFDGNDLMFTFVTSNLCPEGEFGYTSLSELKSVRNRFGLGIERDIHFDQKPLSKCK